MEEQELLKVKDELAKLQKTLAVVENDKQEAEDALVELSQHLTIQEEQLEALQQAQPIADGSEIALLTEKLKKAELESERLSEQLLVKDLSISQFMTEIGDLKDIIESTQATNAEIEDTNQSKILAEKQAEQLVELQQQISHLSDLLDKTSEENVNHKQQLQEQQTKFSTSQNEAETEFAKQQVEQNQSISKLKNRVAELEQQVEVDAFDNKMLQEEVIGYQSDIEKQVGELSSLQQLTTSLTEKIDHLEELLEEKTQLGVEYKLKFQGAEESNKTLSLELSKKEQAYIALEEQLSSSKDNVVTQIEKVQNLELQIHKLEKRNAELVQEQVRQEQQKQANVESLESTIKELNDSLDSQKTDFIEQIADLNAKYIEKESALTEALANSNKLTNLLEISQKETKNALETATKSKSEQQLIAEQKIDQQKQQYQQQIAELNAKYIEKENALTQASREAAEQLEAHELQKSEQAAIWALEKEQLERQKVDVDTAHQQLQNNLLVMTAQLKDLESERDSLQGELLIATQSSDENSTALTKQNKELAEKVAVAEDRASSLQSRIGELEQQYQQQEQQLQQQIEQLQQQNQQQEQQLQQQIEQLQQQTQQQEQHFQQQIDLLNVKKDDLANLLASAEENDRQSQQQIAALNAKYIESENALTKANRETAEQLEAYEAQKIEQAANWAIEKEQIERQKVDVDIAHQQLQNNLLAMTAQLQDVERERDNLQGELLIATQNGDENSTALTQQNKELAEKVKVAEDLASSLQSRIGELELKYQQQIDQLNVKNDDLANILALANENDRLSQQQITQLKVELAETKEQLVAYQEKVASNSNADDAMAMLEATNSRLAKELKTISDAKQELQEQFNYSEQKAASLQAQLSTAQNVSTEQSDQLLETNIEFNELIETLKIENAQMKNDFEQLKVRFDDSMGQLAQVDDDLVESQQRLREVKDELRKERERNHQVEHELKLVNEIEQQHRDELEAYKQGHIEETELVAEAEIDHARTVIQQLRAENSRLKTDLDEKISELESQVTEYRLKFNFAQQQLVAQQQLSEQQS